VISDDVEQTASEPDAAGDDGAALGEAIRALPKKNGRPSLKMVQGLGAIQATTLECAAVLNVNESTFVAFLAREPEAREAFATGKGKLSLRRLQRRHAETSVPMAIHLGKHWIDQTDKLRAQLTGKNDGPVQIQAVADGLPTDEEFRAMPAAGREAVIAAQEAILAIRQRELAEFEAEHTAD
jgi:hypothetical protein